MKFTCTVRGKILLESYKDWIGNTDKVLDVGCGNGVIGKMISDKFGCRIEGTDIMNFIESGIAFKMMPNETTLPYEEGSFDIAILNDMLHHTTKQKEVIAEALRVAKKVLIFETKPTYRAKILDHVLNWVHNVKMPIPLTHRTLENWKYIFDQMGINSEHKELSARFYYPLTHFAFKICKE